MFTTDAGVLCLSNLIATSLEWKFLLSSWRPARARAEEKKNVVARRVETCHYVEWKWNEEKKTLVKEKEFPLDNQSNNGKKDELDVSRCRY